ncbi:MAG TPA: Ni/Fe hydrogenase subunit alpha [Dissulfurispiraceae bacterium]|nr:Ni/Fe hydrogenase subunit alpha [Dissulfurispiraceae bacterium]
MSQRIVVEPVTRIEGHGKITIQLDDDGKVTDAKLHVTQFRGFEKFTEGRPFYEMPSLVERICGICPISHSLSSAKACDEILGVRIPDTAVKVRKLYNCGEYIQSHALSFFHLSAPDLLLGMDSDPAKRNILGLIEANPALAVDGVKLRKIGQEIIRLNAGRRIHPFWVVPGGVNEPISVEHRDQMLAMLPEALDIIKKTLGWFKKSFDNYREEIKTFSNFPSLFMALVTPEGHLAHVYGKMRFIDAKGNILVDQIEAADYQKYIGEATENFSFMKSPYFLPLGYPDGMYRCGPAARLNVCSGTGMPLADEELAEFRKLGNGGPVLSSFHNHYARLIEILYSIELAEKLLRDPEITSERIRSIANPNHESGVGIVEAPRGTLFHHYKVDKNGLMTWANMIVATGNNNLAINKGILQVAQRFVDGKKLTEGALNRCEAIVRAFDPCLSCATHALGQMPLIVELVDADGTVVHEVKRG